MAKSGKHYGNFFLCHYVFKKPSVADVSESVYMREMVNPKYTLAITSSFWVYEHISQYTTELRILKSNVQIFSKISSMTYSEGPMIFH